MAGDGNATETRLLGDHWFDVRSDSTSSAERVNNEAGRSAVESSELSSRGARDFSAKRDERRIVDHGGFRVRGFDFPLARTGSPWLTSTRGSQANVTVARISYDA